jgi:hypothetical protein
MGISLSKIVESAVLVVFGVADPMNIIAWVTAFLLFFFLFILIDEFNDEV